MEVSVTVITKNEAAILRKMLQAVRWAKEIVVVDSGSDDGTPQIAREFTDRVINREFTDYSSQKNFAHSQASHDWILNLDADEICTAALAAEIQQLPEEEKDAYQISRENYFQGKRIRHCGWSPDYKLRLYRKSKGTWEGKVHEGVRLKNPLNVSKLNHGIEHYTYRGFTRYVGAIHRYSELAAEQMKEQGKTAGIFDLIWRPPAAFLKKFLFQGGFLDGSPGFVISSLTAYGVFCRYTILREIAVIQNSSRLVASHDENCSR